MSKSTLWPKLSRQLDGPRDPDHCQSCGEVGSLDPTVEAPGLQPTALPALTAWCEHDANDQPTRAIVVLCKACSDKHIAKHPRLYAAQPYWIPLPGIMGLCWWCKHREGTACRSPLATFNGGPGLEVRYPEPSRVHFFRCGKGARSGWETIYTGPPRSCSGREAKSPEGEAS